MFSGGSSDGGHYVAFSKIAGQWWLLDDCPQMARKVEASQMAAVLGAERSTVLGNGEVYMVFYQKAALAAASGCGPGSCVAGDGVGSPLQTSTNTGSGSPSGSGRSPGSPDSQTGIFGLSLPSFLNCPTTAAPPSPPPGNQKNYTSYRGGRAATEGGAAGFRNNTSSAVFESLLRLRS